MLRLKPYNIDDADVILSWSKDEMSFYKWSAGVLGEYPITKEKFGFVNGLMAFTATEDDELVVFFTMRRPSESFDDVIFDNTETYCILGEEWKCKELIVESYLNKFEERKD